MSRRSKYNYCGLCTKKVLKPVKHCEECLPNFLEIEKMLEPARKTVAIIKPRCIAIGVNLNKAKEAALSADREVSRIEGVLEKVLGDALGIDWDSIELGIHDCEHSPTGHCIYDDDKDPCHDSCLLCAQPYCRQ